MLYMRPVMQGEKNKKMAPKPDFEALRRAVDAHTAAGPPDFAHNLLMAEAMHLEARRRGRFGTCGLEDLGLDIRLARVMNHVNRPA